jgi:methionyl-tRNA formyltransferase
MVFDGAPMLGATVHRTAADFDTGAILSQHVAPMPDRVTPEAVLPRWSALIRAALDEGVARALANEPGTPQDATAASYAAPFTPEERWLAWDLPAAVVQRRATALNLYVPQARAWIDGRAYQVEQVTCHPAAPPRARPGTVLERSGDTVVLQTADGIAHLTARAIS